MEIDLQPIAEELEKEVCPVHNQHPTLTVTEEGKISSTHCCVEFSNSITDLLNKKVSAAITQKIRDTFYKGGE